MIERLYYEKESGVREMNEYLQALKGISYPEWIKVKIAMDGAFERQKRELEKELKFSNIEDAERVIRSQFG